MEELFEIPDEFLNPIIPCLGLLKLGNIHVYEKPKGIWYKHLLSYLILPCVISYHTALTLYMSKVFRGEIQLDELAYVVSVYAISTQSILKGIIVTRKKKEIRTVILELGRMWRTQDLTEVQISKKNALLKRLKFCYAVFYWMNIIGSWQYILAPLLETVFRKYILLQECGLLLPFSCSFPFDPTGNWARYIGVYIFETYSMFRIIFYYLGVEFLMITLCSHLATAFTLLQEDLLLVKPGDKLEEIKYVIGNHQKLTSIAEQLDNIFDKVIFVDLTSASISICFFGFGTKVARGFLAISTNFVAVVCSIVPLFNLCYYCELVRETSAKMADCAYTNSWYRGDIRYQKLLWFIIIRSQKPCCMTSMKLNAIDLTTFTTVLSTTWSYFSLASSLYEGES